MDKHHNTEEVVNNMDSAHGALEVEGHKQVMEGIHIHLVLHSKDLSLAEDACIAADSKVVVVGAYSHLHDGLEDASIPSFRSRASSEPHN